MSADDNGTGVQILLALFILIMLPYIFWPRPTKNKRVNVQGQGGVQTNVASMHNPNISSTPYFVQPVVQPTTNNREVYTNNVQLPVINNYTQTVVQQEYKPIPQTNLAPIMLGALDLRDWRKWFEPLCKDWVRSMPHLLLVGATGDGKSTLALAIIKARIKQGFKVIVIDEHSEPKKWGSIKTFGGGEKLAEINNVLNAVMREYKQRIKLMNEGAVESEQFSPPLLLVIEEYTNLIDTSGLDMTLTSHQAKRRIKSKIKFTVNHLSKSGRKVNIHLIVAGQDDSVKSLGIEGRKNNKLNFGIIYLGGFARASDSRLKGMERPGVISHGKSYLPILLPQELMTLAAAPVTGDYLPEFIKEMFIGKQQTTGVSSNQGIMGSASTQGTMGTNPPTEGDFEPKVRLYEQKGAGTNHSTQPQVPLVPLVSTAKVSTKPIKLGYVEPLDQADDDTIREAVIEFLLEAGVTRTHIADIIKGRRGDVLQMSKRVINSLD